MGGVGLRPSKIGGGKKAEERTAPKSRGVSLAVGTYLQRGSTPPSPGYSDAGHALVGGSLIPNWPPHLSVAETVRSTTSIRRHKALSRQVSAFVVSLTSDTVSDRVGGGGV